MFNGAVSILGEWLAQSFNCILYSNLNNAIIWKYVTLLKTIEIKVHKTLK